MSNPSTPTLAARRAAILEDIASAAKAGGRTSADVTLVAVSKMQPETRIEEALAAGQLVFGENRV
ncbi:MAG: YggS family pyridoxal phosphate-dependent enzyme, partial [Oceanicaulis sp.]|nr:YggS family pyridoxal phosphate-dependent enzyme [Oceanicaulis sp.]